MNRKEKNQKTRQRIIDSALNEFSKQGYGASSINTICLTEGISKGIIYYYFNTKDDLYLTCVSQCFEELTKYLKKSLQFDQGTMEEKLHQYFSSRLTFFHGHPLYQRIFCEAIINPPHHLKDEINAIKQPFDKFNIDTLKVILANACFRKDISRDEIVEIIRYFQDFTNSSYLASEGSDQIFETYEKKCRFTLSVLLYGVIDQNLNRKED